MPESKSSRYTAAMFAAAMEAVVAPKRKRHDWVFSVGDEWEQSDWARALVEEYASTLDSARAAIEVIQKPHHFIEEIVEYVEKTCSTFEAPYAVEKFGEWYCVDCHTSTTRREERDEDDEDVCSPRK